MLAGFLAGCLIAASTGVGLSLATCAILSRWPASDRAGERVADVGLVVSALAIVLVQALGFIGGLRAGIIAAAAVGCGALACVLERRTLTRATLLLSDVRAGLATVRFSLPLSAAACLGLVLACRGLALPELSWDGLTYHLTYPAFWLQTGGFGRFEAGGVWEQYESFPKAAEALFFLAIVPFHADHFVHWINLFFWLGIAGAVRSAALRLDCDRRTADVCAAIAVGCPALSAYVTPAYVEVPMTFALCAALLAAIRALIGRDAGALGPLWLGLALAVAVKMTAVAYLPLGVLVTLLAIQKLSLRACLRWIVSGVSIGCALALPWYVHNLVQCDNPLYPAALPFATDGPAAGTLANVWAVRETSVLSQRAVGDILDGLARAPWRIRYPLGPGILFLAALPASVALSGGLWLRGFARRRAGLGDRLLQRSAAANTALLLAGLALALTDLYAVSPWNGVFRDANTRFLMPATIAALLSLAVVASQSSAWVGRTLGALGGASVLIALGSAEFVRAGFVEVRATVAIGLLAGSLLAALHATGVARERRARWFAMAGLGLGLSLAALAYAVQTRDANRLEAYRSAVDLHPIAGSPRLWAFVESLPASRIAFTAGDVNATEGWFFYPLFGSRLQHEVRYVDVEATDPPACVRRGLIRDRPDEAAWSARLRALQVDYVVTAGQCLEQTWASSKSQTFRQVFEDGRTRVYRIEGPAPSSQ
jgi:4-amino-4-deoxy-L-arabinose transferase-like glycosyltransferase